MISLVFLVALLSIMCQKCPRIELAIYLVMCYYSIQSRCFHAKHPTGNNLFGNLSLVMWRPWQVVDQSVCKNKQNNYR